MTNYKQLCAELVAAIDAQSPHAASLLDRARAALAEPEPEGLTDEEILELLPQKMRDDLAEPEPEGPTDEEIMELMPQQMHEDLAFAARAMAEQAGTDSTRVKGAMRIILNRHIVDLAHAALTRWGNSSVPQPIPVSERVQQIEDLAADAVSALRYIEQNHGRLYGVGWDRVYTKADHLLPANALPLPEEVEDG